VRRLAETYAAEMRASIANQFQYRGAAFFQLLGFLIEPIVYLVVWRTVAAAAGEVGGYDVGAFTAYYIVWTLVRNMNLALAPGSWDWWIRSGRISNDLLHPVNIYHRQLAEFAGTKFVWIVLWFPVAATLVVVFRPTLDPTLLQGVAFVFAIWLGYVVRFTALFLLGLLSFWTTRASAIVELFVTAEIILSGRLVPLAVLPEWVQGVAARLPFKWTFEFPIETLIGRLSGAEIATGLLTQVVWVAGLGGLYALAWKRAVRRYTAVGS
jgi:ABC-2 type transport system permease protein